jgi:hypothetical protein
MMKVDKLLELSASTVAFSAQEEVDKLPELSASTVAFISLSLSLQLMKATVLAKSSGNLSTFIVICLLQQCLQTVVR